MANKPPASSDAPQPQGGEQEAVEHLAREFEQDGEPEWAAAIRSGSFDLEGEYASQIVLRAIQSALRTKQPAANSSSNELEGNK